MIEENSRTPVYYIYLITNILNGKNYVGKRKCPKFLNPWNDTKYMGSGVHLIRSQKKYGLKNFTKEILAICSSEKENCILETQYISLYREIGKAEYNVAPGGDGGCIGGPYSDEMRQKLHDFRLNQVFTPEQEEKRKEGCREFWNSERSETLKRINSERMKGVCNTMGKHWYHKGEKNVLELYTGKDDLQNFRGSAWGMYNAVADYVSNSEPIRKTDKSDSWRMWNFMAGYPMIETTQDILLAA